MAVSALRAWSSWRPVGDSAVLLLRARDVWGPTSPLVGMPTSLSGATDLVLHHPGPSEFWLLWPAAASGHPGAVVATVAAVNVTSIGLLVAAAHCAAGVRAAAVAAALISLATTSLATDFLIEPLNPAFGLLPFAAYLAALVPLVQRRGRWWFGVAVAFGSVAAQAHVTLAVLVAGTASAAALLALPWSAPRDRRAAGAGAAAALVLWAPGVVDQLAGSGNASALLRAGGARYDAAGWIHAARVGSYAFGRPAWAAPASALDLIRDQPAWRSVIAAALVAALASVSLRRGRGATVVAGRLLVAAIAVGALALSRMPSAFFAVAALHNYLWLWPVSAGAAGVVVARAAGDRIRSGFVVAVSCFALAASGAVAAVAPPRPAVPPWAAAIDHVETRFVAALRGHRVVHLDLRPEFRRFGIGAALALVAEQRGHAVVVDDEFAPSFGRGRARSTVAAEPDATVAVTVGDVERGPEGSRLLGSFTERSTGITSHVWIRVAPGEVDLPAH